MLLKAEVALRVTASNAVYQMAFYSYPLEIANQSLVAQWLPSIPDFLPYVQQFKRDAEQTTLRKVLTPYVRGHIPAGTLQANLLTVEKIKIPSVSGNADPFIQLDVTYSMPIKLPFRNRTILIKKTAVERAWFGSSASLSLTANKQVQIVSVTPNPVKRGTNAIIRAKARAHAVVNIKIYYKSGLSVAKGLIAKKADSTGQVSWKWNVGGNTTPGQWTVNITSEGAQDHMFFEVRAK